MIEFADISLLGLALCEVFSLSAHPEVLRALAAAVVANIGLCYKLARAVEGVGIVMPALVPAAVACSIALMFASSFATPVAFVAGVRRTY